MIRTLALIAVAAALLCAQPNRFDVLITGAKVVDGTGSSWYYADIGIRGDTIAAIGMLPNSTAPVRVDARGLTAAPGFIDIHSHGRRGISGLLLGSETQKVLTHSTMPVLVLR